MPSWSLPQAVASEVVNGTSVRIIASAEKLIVTWDEPREGTLISISGPGMSGEPQSHSGSVSAAPEEPGTKLAYVVTSEAPLSAEDQDEIAKSGYRIPTSDLKLYDSIEIKSLDLTVPDPGQVEIATAATTLPAATSFRYTTFIPQDRIYDWTIYLCPVPVLSYFVGDNRTFDASSTSFRTRVNVRVDWLAGGVVSSTETAGTSTAYIYDASPPFYIATTAKVTDLADMSEVKVTPTSSSSTQAIFKIDHNAVDPLCAKAVEENKGIEYHYTVTIQRSGNYGLTGWALRVPAHEAYIRDSSSPAWKTVFQRENLGFNCLLFRTDPGCRANINYSGSVL